MTQAPVPEIQLEPAPAAGISSFTQDDEKDLLRVSTAGSVDDGKSTLIGRLLYDSNGAYEDQIASIRNSPVNRSSAAFDLALLTDGLRAEREQGITIDVAYRYFSTSKRKFIIADTPGHEQYTRNMATGASTANLAIILVDARNGVLPQSRRHAFIASMLGIQHIVIAVNKMDLADYSETVFEGIRKEFADYASRLQVPDLHFIPISALTGDNVVEKSKNMPWFDGSSLLHYLETVHIGSDRNLTELRFPVQYVIRPGLHFRGYAGQVASGILRAGDPVMVLPSGQTTRIKSIVTYDGELEHAFAPMSVTVCLEDEVDVSRGDMLVPPSHRPHVSRQMDARIVWMHEQRLEIGREYLIRHTTQLVRAVVGAVRHRINVDTLEKESSGVLHMNDMGAVLIEARKPLFFDPYRRNRATGSFILIDPMTNATVAAGMITGREPGAPAASSSDSVFLSDEENRVNSVEQQASAGHRALTVWMNTSSALAYRIERTLFDAGCRVHAISTRQHVHYLPEACRILNDAGVIAIVLEPDSTMIDSVRDKVGAQNFLQIEASDLKESTGRTAESIYSLLKQHGCIPRSSEHE